MAKREGARKFAAQNRKARHNYFIDEVLEAGIMLAGTEVKSLRQGKANIGDAYATDKGGEIWLFNVNIPEYNSGGYTRHDNLAMRRVFQKCGFQQEALRRRAWQVDGGEPVDCVGYAILRDEFEMPANG